MIAPLVRRTARLLRRIARLVRRRPAPMRATLIGLHIATTTATTGRRR